MIVSSAANGVNAAVTNDYTATSATANSKGIGEVALNAASGVDVDMVSAGGVYGYDINGGQAASTLGGSKFADSIDGNAAADNIAGNGGNDTINAGAGADTALGGADDDIFTVTTGLHTKLQVTNRWRNWNRQIHQQLQQLMVKQQHMNLTLTTSITC